MSTSPTTGQRGQSDDPEQTAVALDLPPAAPDPRAAPWTVIAGILIGAALFVAGALCIRELLIDQSLLHRQHWIAPFFQWVAQLTWRRWMELAAPLCVVVGLALIFAAMTPRRRTHLRTDTALPLWITPTGAARACSARAGLLGGVSDVETTATRKTVTVSVTVVDLPDDTAVLDDEALDAAVREAIRPVVSRIAAHPRVRIHIRHRDPAPKHGRKGRVV